MPSAAVSQDHAQVVFQHTLDGAELALLAGPAVEVAAVIGEVESDAHVSVWVSVVGVGAVRVLCRWALCAGPGNKDHPVCLQYLAS